MDELNEIQNSVMMMFIGINSSYFSQLLGCKTQKLMVSNIYINHLMEFISLYITVSMSSTPESPLQSLYSALKYYLFFIMFTKMNIIFTIFTFGLMFLVTIIKNYIRYLSNKKSKNNEEENKLYEKIKKLYSFNDALVMMILAIVVTGFVMYFIKQKNDHASDWSFMKFLFGYTGCLS